MGHCWALVARSWDVRVVWGCGHVLGHGIAFALAVATLMMFFGRDELEG